MSVRFKIKRTIMWHQNPHCEKCGVLTVLPDSLPYTIGKDGNKCINPVPDNMATIQHKYDRLHPKRNLHPPEERVLLLWCHKCNREYFEQYERERATAHGNKIRNQGK